MKKSHYRIEIFWSEEDAGYIAEVPDLPGCNAWGATEADASTQVQDAIAAWIAAAKAAKRTIPKPMVVVPLSSHSGKFLVRVPRSLHARLVRKAHGEGVSLNQYVNSALMQSA